MTTRRERVVLELDDQFTGPAARAAAAAALLNREVSGIGGSSRDVGPSMDRSARGVDGLGSSSRRAGPEIDRLSGRLGLLAKGALAFGPAAIPITAAAIPAVTGLAQALGVAALAGGTAVLAFQGVGTALEALNKAQLDPTSAHLKAARLAMEDLSPAASDFVRALDQMGPVLDKLKQSAGADLFPGLVVAMRGAETRLPQVRGLLEAVGGAVGNLGEMTGESLNSGKWDDFLSFLKAEAPPAIESLGRMVGSLASGVSELWMAFAPLNDDVIGWLENAAQSFEDWSTGLSQTQGFADFVQYMRDAGPQVAEALGAIGNAVLQVTEAFAPLGGPVLTVLTTVADLIGTIADSPLGAPLAAIATAVSMLSLLNKGLASAQGMMSGLGRSGGDDGAEGIGSFFQENADQVREAAGSMRASLQGVGSTLRTSLGAGLAPTAGQMMTLRTRMSEVGAAGRQMATAVGRAGVPVAALGLLSTGAAGGLGITNTASLALAGSMAGPVGAAVGVGVGALLDLKAAGAGATDALGALNGAAALGNLDVMRQKIAEAKKELDDYKSTDFSGFLGLGDITQRIGTDISNVAQGRFSDQTDEYSASIEKASEKEKEMAASARVAADAQASLSSYVSGSNVALFAQTQSLEAAVKSMQAMRSEALKGIDGQLSYKSAILDARDAIKENGRTLDLNTRAGIANKTALKTLAQAWNGQSDAAKNAQGSLKAARSNFIQTAQAMGMPIEQARTLAKRLFEIPSKRVTTVTVLTDADKKVAAINAQLNSIDRNIDVYVNIRKPNAGGMGPQIGNSADGGEVVGAPRYPYRDKVLYALAPGEEIISNRYGQADRFRSDRAAGVIPGYADGGTTGDKTKSKPARRTSASLISGDLDLSHGLKAALRDLKHDLSDLDKQVQLSTDAVDAETTARDALQSQFDSLSGSVSGQFQSDLFASGGSAFGSNAASDPIGVLMADIANSGQFQSLFAGLQNRGLSGGALTAAAQGGTSALQTLSGYSQADLERYQQLYATRDQQSAMAGQQAAQAQFGAGLDQANVYLAQLVAKEDQVLAAQRDVKQAVNQGEKATKEISSSTAKGHRSKPRGRK